MSYFERRIFKSSIQLVACNEKNLTLESKDLSLEPFFTCKIYTFTLTVFGPQFFFLLLQKERVGPHDLRTSSLSLLSMWFNDHSGKDILLTIEELSYLSCFIFVA